MKGIIILSVILLFIGWLFIFDTPMHHDLPWRTVGNYFTIEWMVPDNTVRYRGYWSTDSLKMINDPFSCRQFKIPAPNKTEPKQQHIIRYVPEGGSAYDLYYRVFAFDIDGNCENIKFLDY